jgi:DNA repair photolyase
MPGQLKLRKVISASRRTDLIAHYPGQLAHRLRDLGDHVHTVVVWTKDVTNLLRHEELREALAFAGQIFVHWTITGLGGSFLEPHVPPPANQLALLAELLAYLGDPRRLHWRYDPLISARRGHENVSNVGLDMFRALASPLASARVAVVHTSFVTLYPKVLRRLASAGVEVIDLPANERLAFLRQLSASADDMGIRMVTCCEPAFGRQRCIDGDLLMELHPTHEPCRDDRAREQRELCGCTASLDVGAYLPCPNRCLYCYAHPAGS